MAFWKRILVYPLLGGIAAHLLGACLAGVMLMYLHYQNNFNAHPELIQEYWRQLVMVGQFPMFGGFILGVIAAFVGD
jgi:hypothetical protein